MMAVWPPSAEDLMKVNKELQEENKRLQKSLRDEFAMVAMAGLMSATNSEGEWTHTVKYAANISYEAADEMLKARDKERE